MVAKNGQIHLYIGYNPKIKTIVKPQRSELIVAKYPMNGELEMQAAKIDAMHKSCTATNVQYTPTIFIKGHQLPKLHRNINHNVL